jgi:methionyl-tRNA formyltransferase
MALEPNEQEGRLMTSPTIDVLCSDTTHPLWPRLQRWQAELDGRAEVRITAQASELGEGDFLFLVACQQIIPASVRRRYRHPLVVHESDLPKGRGWSPLVWQVLEGQQRIPVTLIEAADAVDAGPIWHQVWVELDGTELNGEIHSRVADATIELMTWAVAHCDHATPREQQGQPSYYARRTPADSEVAPTMTFEQAFDLLRVADEDRYPAFIRMRGKRYRIRLDLLPEEPA